MIQKPDDRGLEAAPRLGHVHLKVRNLARSVSFYSDLFGLRVTESVDDRFAFLSSTTAHHDLALQALGDGAAGSTRSAVGLYHVAFEVDSPAALASFATALERRGVDYRFVDHGISQALYFEDPDDNGLEVFVDRRVEAGQLWQGRSRRTLAGRRTDGVLDPAD